MAIKIQRQGHVTLLARALDPRLTKAEVTMEPEYGTRDGGTVLFYLGPWTENYRLDGKRLQLGDEVTVELTIKE